MREQFLSFLFFPTWNLECDVQGNEAICNFASSSCFLPFGASVPAALSACCTPFLSSLVWLTSTHLSKPAQRSPSLRSFCVSFCTDALFFCMLLNGPVPLSITTFVTEYCNVYVLELHCIIHWSVIP